MSQTYAELNGTDTLKASRSTINSNFDAIKTDFSGTSAPFTASSTTLGATYYNTSDNKTYRVVQSGSNYVWTDINTLMPTAETESNTTVGANTAFVTKAVSKTNCITEIPQDIKLELNNGTLTLKSGSIITNPNGTQLILTTDRSTTQTTDGIYLVCPSSSGGQIQARPIENCVSGAGATTTFGFAYDTTTNKINNYSASGEIGGEYDLPVCIVTVSNGAISSIDQTFNGFGYIGSTVFALPGVKGVRPNGRNSDGTLKNIYWTCNSVVVRTFPVSDNNTNAPLGFDGSSFARISRNSYSYNQSKNYNYNNASVWIVSVIGSIDETAGIVSNFNVKPAFHAADYYDLNNLASEVSTLDSGNVKTTGNQSIAGNKTFSGSTTFSGSVSLGSSATATTKSATDNSTAVSTTAFVKLLVPVSIGSGTKPVYTNSSGVITASNSDVGSATQPIYMNKGTLTAGTELNTAAYVADNTLVHKAGTEEITGNKTLSGTTTFTNSVNRKGSWTAGTPGSSNQTSYINFTDSTGTSYGSIGKFYGAGGTFVTEMTGKKTDGTGEIKIAIGYDASGNPRATAPTPDTATNTTSTQIATTGWVNTVGNNVMHLTGDESVGGNKTFTSQLALNAGLKFNNSTQGYITATAQNSAINIGTAPSTNTGYQVNLEDSTGGINHRVGGFVTIYKTNGSIETQIKAYKPDGSGQTQAEVAVIYPASGSPYATCPTPSSTTDNSTKIATTAWIHNWVEANGGFSTFTKGGKGGFKLGNGLVVNWGRNGSTSRITFAVPFTSNTSYSVSTAVDGTEQGGTSWGQVNSLTSTGLNLVGPASSKTIYWLAIGY